MQISSVLILACERVRRKRGPYWGTMFQYQMYKGGVSLDNSVRVGGAME